MRVVFMGSSSASAECLRAIMRESSLEVVGVVSQPDRPVGRGKIMTPCPLAQFAASHGIGEIIKPENVNAEEAMEQLRAWRPDVVAVVAYGQILRKPLLELPVHGCVNCHFSLLPKYRGASPVIAALKAGELMTGVTVMRMGVGLDDGPIMLQRYEPIYPDTTGGGLMNDLAIAGGVTLAKALRMMAANSLPPEVPQDNASATYAGKLRKSDGLIDWSRPALRIECEIRAFHPWPGCWTFLPQRLRKRGNGGRLVVMRARFAKLEPGWENAAPGTVVKLEKSGPVIKCGDTALILTEVKPEGGSQMDGAAFLRGRSLVPGSDAMAQE